MKILATANFEDMSRDDLLLACNGLNALANLGLSPLALADPEDLVGVALNRVRSIVAICSNFPEGKVPNCFLTQEMTEIVRRLTALEDALREDLNG